MKTANHFVTRVTKLPRAAKLNAPPVISVTALAGVPEFVRNAFGEPTLRRATRAIMLDIEAIEDADSFVPHVTMAKFVQTVAALAGEESFGLMLAPHLTIANYGCWGEYLLGASTLGAAIQRGIGTIGFHTNGDTLSISILGDQARVSYASAAKGLEGYPHVACGAAGVVVSLCRSFLPSDWRPDCVELDFPKPRGQQAFEEAFRCTVLFDAPSITVCFDKSWLTTKAQRRSKSSLVTVEDLARARVDSRMLAGLRDALAEQVWSQVLAGSVSIDSAARSLDVSVRTLQRELSREGTDFRSITSIVRARRAKELLGGTDESISRISTALGYSSPTHFARAFRKATGLSPREFRSSVGRGTIA